MLFGFAEVDFKSPKGAVGKFEEFPPLFYDSLFSQEAIPEHMKEYLEPTKRIVLQYYKICGWLAGEKTLFYALLLEWYLDHGLKITAVHRTIGYRWEKIFTWLVNKVTENRRKRDEDPDKALA